MKLYFITDNRDIKDALIEMGIKEKINSFDTKTSREWLNYFISRNPTDFCRGIEMFGYLRENLLDTKNTSIFIHGGFEVLGLVNFEITEIGGVKTIITKGICVPERDTKEKRGSVLLDVLKNLAQKIDIQKIVIYSLPNAKVFYQKNGFIEDSEEPDYMIYNIDNKKISRVRSMKKTHTRTQKSPIKSLPTRMYINKSATTANEFSSLGSKRRRNTKKNNSERLTRSA
jgi:hypothetical protein